ncbi:MAG: dual specificity protein phosphatase family protein [Victivallales bacterium]|nr:dual specificity protein phosphatase family protein [Victivallales bacterium]MBR6057144.1 dual specificity protein phosphatase family protein [Victivallales bacterium]
MKIDVKPWSYFNKTSYSKKEQRYLNDCRVISILDSDGPFSISPFRSDVYMPFHLLTLRFDDYDDSVEKLPEGAVPCTEDDVEKIVSFVQDDGLPLIVHCSDGISRSGAVAAALDQHFNEFMVEPKDHAYFLKRNRGLRPNKLVLKLLKEALEQQWFFESFMFYLKSQEKNDHFWGEQEN